MPSGSYRQRHVLASEFHEPERLEDAEAYARECAESPKGKFMPAHRVRRRAAIIREANRKAMGGAIDTGNLD